MTTGISQTGTEYQAINPRMSEPNPEGQSKQDKVADGPVVARDTVIITADVSGKPELEFEPIDEEQAAILAQLVANGLNGRSVGMSTPEGMDVLRASI